MTLPTGTISMSQVNTELSRSATAAISMNDTAVRNLAGVASGAISMSQLRGKSAVPALTAMGFNGRSNGFTNNQPTEAWAYPSVLAEGGSGGYTYLWEFVVANGCSFGSAWHNTIQNPSIYKFINRAGEYVTATLRCTVRDSAGSSVVVNNIQAIFEWENT